MLKTRVLVLHLPIHEGGMRGSFTWLMVSQEILCVSLCVLIWGTITYVIVVYLKIHTLIKHLHLTSSLQELQRTEVQAK